MAVFSYTKGGLNEVEREEKGDRCMGCMGWGALFVHVVVRAGFEVGLCIYLFIYLI